MPDPVRSAPTEYLADGSHAGLRWYLQRLDGLELCSVNGFQGADYVTETCEMPGATPAMACALVDALIAARAAKQARKARR